MLVSVLFVYALCEFARRALRGDLLATAPLAALAGLLVVGMFDSLLDVPRLTLLIYLLLFLSMVAGTGRRVPGPR